MKKMVLALFACISFFSSWAQAPYTLPQLRYAYNALEPHIDAQTMEIHHSKHHSGYVNNLNKALENNDNAAKSLIDLLLGISKTNDAIRNNAGGHYNHSLFWEVLAPAGTGNFNPESDFGKACIKQFGSVEALKKQISDSAAKRFGSGWAWLIVTPTGTLQVSSTPNQDNPLMDVAAARGIPVLGIDVWEHAYYLKYQNKRADYLSAIWQVVNWSEVNTKYQAAINNPLLKKLGNK